MRRPRSDEGDNASHEYGAAEGDGVREPEVGRAQRAGQQQHDGGSEAQAGRHARHAQAGPGLEHGEQHELGGRPQLQAVSNVAHLASVVMLTPTATGVNREGFRRDGASQPDVAEGCGHGQGVLDVRARRR